MIGKAEICWPGVFERANDGEIKCNLTTLLPLTDYGTIDLPDRHAATIENVSTSSQDIFPIC
jgi:hypothetical protein